MHMSLGIPCITVMITIPGFYHMPNRMGCIGNEEIGTMAPTPPILDF